MGRKRCRVAAVGFGEAENLGWNHFEDEGLAVASIVMEDAVGRLELPLPVPLGLPMTYGETPSTRPVGWNRTGLPGQIQVAPNAYERSRYRYRFEPREPVEVKGKGVIVPYLLMGRDVDAPTAATLGDGIATN